MAGSRRPGSLVAINGYGCQQNNGPNNSYPGGLDEVSKQSDPRYYHPHPEDWQLFDLISCGMMIGNLGALQHQQQQQQQEGGGGGHKIGGLATTTLSCSSDFGDKENEEHVTYANEQQKQAVMITPKRRLSSVTECGEFIEEFTGMEERLGMAISWLKSNYYEHSTGSVSRSDLYDKYVKMCGVMQSEPMNMATLGKHIRNIFPAIITRRLGNRGNSKYHYYGMAEVGVSLLEDGEPSSSAKKKPRKIQLYPASDKGANRQREAEDLADGMKPLMKRAPAPNHHHHQPTFNIAYPIMDSFTAAPDYDEFHRLQQEICTFAVGDLNNCEHAQDLRGFAQAYQVHTVDLLKRIYERDFLGVERLISAFWGKLQPEWVTVLEEAEEALRLVSVADDYLYQVAINLLLPDVIEPCPLVVLQSVRVFAKTIDHWFTDIILATGQPAIMGTKNLPPRLVEIKIDLARRFAVILRRRTSVNHLAQAMISVLVNKIQVQHMIHDWDHIDFTSIREQSKWILGNKEPFISYIEVSIKSYLMEEAAMPMWTHWLENLIEQYIAVEMASGRTLDKAAKNLLLGWSYYHTLVLRDLTLRSASSFGSFHIMRLFLEEYVIYYAERKLDEHRRAVGMLSSWPRDPTEEQASSSMDCLPKASDMQDVDREDQIEDRNGLQVMSSVADHHFSELDSATVKNYDRYQELSNLLS